MIHKKQTSHKDVPFRREAIVRLLKTQGTLTYGQIQQQFKVAPMTARRDVAALHSQGRAIKTLRGAMRISAEDLLIEGPLHSRLRENLGPKRAIARKAVALISPGNTLHLDGGTTSIELARVIAQSQLAVTIVTNSVLVSACFCGGSATKVIQMGGALNMLNGCTTGPETEEAAKNYFIDIGFFSTRGYVPGEGTFESSADTYRVKLAFAERCSKVVLLMDHSKVGQRALNRVLLDTDIDCIVMDRSVHGFRDERIILA